MIYVYSLKQIPQIFDNLLKLLIQVIEYTQREIVVFQISILLFSQKITTECLLHA